MIEKFKIFAEFVKDLSSETKDLETYLYVKEYLKNYNLKLWKVYKPDFVGNIPNDHSSRSIITNRFKRPTRTV